MKLLPVFLLFLQTVLAEDIYIAATALGTGSGTSAANAKAFTFFNSSGNWTSSTGTDGLIGPGDTVHVTGIINMTGTSASSSNTLSFQGGGTSGNPITLKFDAGGRIRHATSFPTGLIYASGSGIHDIIIEGANSSSVKVSTTQIDLEVYDNGTNLGNQVEDSRIIFIDNAGGDITLKNLYLYGAYVREYQNTSDLIASQNIVTLKGQDNLIIDNCRADHGEGGFGLTGMGAVNSNLRVTNCYVYATSTAIKLGVVDSGMNDGVICTGNILDGFAYWAGIPNPNQHHCDGIQSITGTNPTVPISHQNYTVAYNRIGPDLGLYGSMNAHIFFQTSCNGLFIYNNLLLANPTPTNPAESNRAPGTANGFITAGTTSTFFDGTSGIRSVIANNTIMGYSGGQGINSSFVRVEGNIVRNIDTIISVWDNHADNVTYGRYFISNKNVFYKVDGGYQFGLSGYQAGEEDFAGWQALGFDANSVAEDPKVTFPTGVLASDSPAIEIAPTQSLFTDDFNGNPRSVPWDAGAIEFAPGSTNIQNLNVQNLRIGP